MPRVCPAAIVFLEKPFREKLRDTVGLKQVAVQNFLENGVNNPLLYFPIFYTIQEFLNKGAEAKVGNALKKYVNNAHEDIPAIWSVWVPVQFFNFGFSPLWMRVPVVAMTSAFWTAYVSITRGGSPSKEEPQEAIVRTMSR
eukprot:CAMPEP_0172609590 /NCGR_PEP_ID=MMETSP1068-20121228/29570_1 /TAXON_ID=35684 /ORGANISM="Pseudopedinella elastica, Strain CCMP716" /LENGTH=140 /DNA_ID=CAMNT_0013413147 /DNA_START=32 /DNA_END=454 /DNA_ORIENTATION=-